MDEGLQATAALVKSKLHKTLQKFLEKNIVKKNLQVRQISTLGCPTPGYLPLRILDCFRSIARRTCAG